MESWTPADLASRFTTATSITFGFWLPDIHRFLNFKIDNIRVLDEAKHPHMVSPTAFHTAPSRNNTLSDDLPARTDGRQVGLHSRFRRSLRSHPAAAVDTQLLEDANKER